MKTADLIDQARATSGFPSDYQLAKRVGVSRQVISQWRTGTSYPAIRFQFDLAELAGRNPAAVIAELEEEREIRAGQDAQAETWRARLQRLATTAAVVVGAVVISPSPAQSQALARANAVSASDGMYIMLNTV